jgi:hypothetical protein
MTDQRRKKTIILDGVSTQFGPWPSQQQFFMHMFSFLLITFSFLNTT